MTIPHRKPGDKKLPAKDYNSLVDAANITLRNRPIANSEANENEGRTPGTILIRNDTGEDRERGDAVGIGDQLYDLNYYRIEMKNNSLFAGVSLTSAHVGRFAILAEPVKDGETGEAYIALECYAKIWIPAGANLETHGYADVFDLTTSPNNLTAIGSGTCQILWFDDAVSGDYGDAKVRFCPKIDGVPFVNESGETVPPYGVMEVVEIDDDGIAHIRKPTDRRECIYLINRGVEVLDNYQGIGDYGFDKPVLILSSPPGAEYLSDSPINATGAAFAPRPGYWHLRTKHVGYYPLSGLAEDFGFKQMPWGGKVVEDYGYDWGGDVTGENENNLLAYYFVQQLEQPTLTQTLELDSYLYDTGDWSAPDSEIPYTGNEHYLKLVDTDTKYYSRIGFRTGVQSNTNGLLNFYRYGYYQIDLYFNIEFEGNTNDTDIAGSIWKSANTSTDSGHNHTYREPKIGAFSPSGITVRARGTIVTDTEIFRQDFFYVGSSTVIGLHARIRLHVSDTVSSAYSRDLNTERLSFRIEHTRRNEGTARFLGGALTVTRLKAQEYMFENDNAE